jgi:hypothetical protein
MAAVAWYKDNWVLLPNPVSKKSIFLFVMVLVIFVPALVLNLIPRSSGRQANTCINNLRQIQGAKEQWAFEKGKTINDVPIWSDIRHYLRQGMSCPQGGAYVLGRVCESPKCSIGGPAHTIPNE